jgi:hypothetical protein
MATRLILKYGKLARKPDYKIFVYIVQSKCQPGHKKHFVQKMQCKQYCLDLSDFNVPQVSIKCLACPKGLQTYI